MFFNIRKSILVIVISLIIYGIGIGAYVATAQTPSSAIPLTIDGIECNANEQFLFHVHAHLNIFVNGQLMYIPSQIGIFLRNAFTGYIHTMKPASYISNHR